MLPLSGCLFVGHKVLSNPSGCLNRLSFSADDTSELSAAVGEVSEEVPIAHLKAPVDTSNLPVSAQVEGVKSL